MRSSASSWVDRSLFALWFGVLLALAWPGVEVKAEEARDVAPSARELLGMRARSAAAPAAANAAPGCEAKDPSRLAAQYEQRQQQMREIAQAMGGGELKPMNGRGYLYEQQRNPALDLLRIQLEARALDREAPKPQ
jgi:hypothetical protein